MTIRHCKPFLSALAVLLAAATACAQTTTTNSEKTTKNDPEWYIRPGITLGGRATYFHSDDSSAARRNWYGGAQLRLHFTPYIAAEGSVDYRQEHFNSPDVTSDIYPVQASLLVYLTPWARLSPFALGGVGWYFTHTNGPNGSVSQNRFGPHAGAGLELALSEHWSIDGTWRYVWVNDINTQGITNVTDRHYNGNGWMATGGVNFRF